MNSRVCRGSIGRHGRVSDAVQAKPILRSPIVEAYGRKSTQLNVADFAVVVAGFRAVAACLMSTVGGDGLYRCAEYGADLRAGWILPVSYGHFEPMDREYPLWTDELMS